MSHQSCLDLDMNQIRKTLSEVFIKGKNGIIEVEKKCVGVGREFLFGYSDSQ
jgi:hypothetical protein